MKFHSSLVKNFKFNLQQQVFHHPIPGGRVKMPIHSGLQLPPGGYQGMTSILFYVSPSISYCLHFFPYLHYSSPVTSPHLLFSFRPYITMRVFFSLLCISLSYAHNATYYMKCHVSVWIPEVQLPSIPAVLQCISETYQEQL